MKTIETFKKIFNSKKTTIILLLAVVLMLANTAFMVSASRKDAYSANEHKELKKVQVSTIKAVPAGVGATIKTVGKVMPSNSVEVKAQASGKVKGSFFKLGDKVSKNQVLAYLENDMTSISLSGAQTSYLNMLNNLDVTKRAADENIRQAEIGVTNAKESVRLAEVSLESAKNSYDNGLNLQGKGGSDIRTSALVSYAEYINFFDSSLSKINYLIGAESGERLTGAEGTLSDKNTQALLAAQNDYRLAKAAYDSIKGSSPDKDTITSDLSVVAKAFPALKRSAEGCVAALNNTDPGSSLSQSSLLAQRDIYSGLVSSVVAEQNKLEGMISSLNGIGLNDKSSSDSLSSAVSAAESQLAMAKSGYDNALVNLERSKKAKEQQVLSAQMSIDSTLTQLKVSRDQFSDLTIKAPIDGEISRRAIDLGTEVSVGQTVAEIAQTDILKIEANLSVEDAARISIGSKVSIEGGLEAEVTNISPVADQFTRKVKIEISFDNKDKELFSGSTVKIEIKTGQLENATPGSIYLPLKSVNIEQDQRYIFIVENGVARKIIIETGSSLGDEIEILSGLMGGEDVVVDGAKSLSGGEGVEVTK